MRISDWSSDVCSSDLKFVPFAFSPDGSEVFAGYSVNDGPVSLVRSNLAATSRTTLASDDFGSIGDEEWNAARLPFAATDRKSGVSGKSVSVRVDLGGRRIIKKKHTKV